MPAASAGSDNNSNTDDKQTMDDGGGGGDAAKSGGGVDPFTRKSSVKKIIKYPKKQQGSSRFRSTPNVEIQPLALLKGMYVNLCVMTAGFMSC